jgi:hypothetical protein
MSISMNRDYNLKTFQVGELLKAFSEPATTLGEGVVFKQMILQEWHPDSSLSTNSHNDLLPLETICDLSTFTIYLTYTDSKSGSLEFILRSESNALVVRGKADSSVTLTEAFDFLERRLALTHYKETKKDSDAGTPPLLLTDLDARLIVLEQRFLHQKDYRCFLSYRFTKSNILQALRLQHFLDLLGVRVTTGASYEPRRVTDKILSKLKDPIDFIVVLVTEDGESFWTRDETATAIHRELPLIPVVQNGVTFEAGLFGDLEYINFDKDHIGDAFLKLLEAVTFIKNQSSQDNIGTARKE